MDGVKDRQATADTRQRGVERQDTNMNSNFDRALRRVLISEGGYVNDPKDPGGETNKGITKRVYDAYRTRNGLARQSVRNISDAEVQQIYRQSYWDLAHCDELPSGVDYVTFDGAVNSGVGQSVKWLQMALGVKTDGVIGPATLAAANSYDAVSLIDAMVNRRLAFLKTLKTWPRYGKGWASRLTEVRSIAKAWAVGSAVASPVLPSATGSAKAPIENQAVAPSTGVADATTGSGVGLAAVAGTLQQASDQLAPVAGANSTLTTITIVLGVAATILVLAGVLYGIWARRKAASIAKANEG